MISHPVYFFVGVLMGIAIWQLSMGSGRRMLAVIWGDLRDIWSDEDRRLRNITLALVGGLWALYLFIAMVLAAIASRFIPIEQRINHVQTYQKIVKIKQVFIPVPSDVKYAPLSDPKKACLGAPVIITSIDVSHSQDDAKGYFTWLAVRPAGDAYTVQCNMAGDYSESWHVGDLISLPAGKVTG